MKTEQITTYIKGRETGYSSLSQHLSEEHKTYKHSKSGLHKYLIQGIPDYQKADLEKIMDDFIATTAFQPLQLEFQDKVALTSANFDLFKKWIHSFVWKSPSVKIVK